MKAAENCSIEIIDLLLKKGADPFVKNKKGRTADQYAKQKQPDSGIELIRMASQGNPRRAHQLILTALRLATDKKINHLPDDILQEAIAMLRHA